LSALAFYRRDALSALALICWRLPRRVMLSERRVMTVDSYGHDVEPHRHARIDPSSLFLANVPSGGHETERDHI
jgi:hypothetical protein